MHRSASRAAFLAGAVTVACLGPLAAEASATVTPTGPVTFSNVGAVTLANTSAGSNVTCTSSVLKGNVSAMGFPINSATFTSPLSPGGDCAAGGLSVKVTPQGLPWNLQLVSHSAGVTQAKLLAVRFQFTGSDGCVATATGPSGGSGVVDATYTNATARLQLYGGTASNLRVGSTNGLCDPLIFSVGDDIRVQGIYRASPALVITYP